MTSVAPLPAGAVGSRSGLESQRPPISSGEMVRTIMDRMAHALRDSFSVQPVNFFQLCIWFSKAVDNAVINNDIPYKVSDLVQLVKKVYDRKNDTCLRPAIMVLMFAFKNACRNKWFIKSDTDELLALSTEISSHFCKGENLIIDTNNILSIMSKVITRFYPQFRMGRLIISVEAKVGFSVLATDFYVLQNLLTSPRERICLFISQVNNLETSSCITSPPQVNFLINGIGVEKRTSMSMESGAQLPTDVTWMVKVGINLLQAIGNFSSNYVIAIVVMTTVPSVDAAPLTDYVQPAVSEIPSDDELIEGPSRISLNCPISFQRIRNPVKGQSCKHLQCFDYENFMEINLRKPSWRCPHCNQSVDCTDLRIDQNMLKVLREVGNDVSDVLISPDWSWKPYSENSDVDQLHSHSSHGTGEHLDHSVSQKCERLVDLTAEVGVSDEAVHIRMGRESSRQNMTQYTHVSDYGTIDMKPSEETLEGLATSCLSGTPYFHTSATTQSHDYQSLRDALARPIPPNYPHGSAVSAVTIPEVPLSALSYPRNTMTPTDVDPVTTGPSRELVDTQTMYQPEQRSMQLQPGGRIVAAQDSIQMQGSWAATPTAIIESRRLAIPRDVIRVPSAVQALPAPSQMQTALARGKRNAGYTNAPVSSQSLPLTTANPDGLIVVSAERQQLRQQTNLSFPEHASTMPMHLNPQERHHPPNQPVVGLAALSSSSLRNSLDQQMGLRMTQSSTLQDIRNVRPRPGSSTRVPHTSRPFENVVQPVFFHSFPAQQPLQPSSNLTATVRPPLAPGATTNQRLLNPNNIGNSCAVADQRLNIPVSPVLPETPTEMAFNQNWRSARMRGSIDISKLNLPGAHTPSMVSQILAQQHAQQAQARPSTVPSTQAAGSAPTPGNTFTSPMSRTQPWAGNAAHR